MWVHLKAANNLQIQTLGVLKADIEMWGQTVRKKGMVVVQNVIDCNVPVILGMNVVQDLGPRN